MTEAPKQAAKSLLKPQYSLRWLFLELTLTGAALGFFAYFVHNAHVFSSHDVFFLFFGFFLAAGSAVGGLAHSHVTGGMIGFVIASAIWPFVLRGLT